MKIHLRSKDLIDVCEKPPPDDASTHAVNKWSKASYEAINSITTRLTERVFQEVVNVITIEKANLLWAKIEDQYAPKRAVNRGQVWMDWQRSFYDGKLGGDTKLHQFVGNLTLNEDIIEKPEKTLTRLQDLAHLYNTDAIPQTTSPTALLSSVEEPHKIVYYCAKGKHNMKCVTHKKEDC
ncbi:hypothetical protein O181_113577, partial [Austropuccinia psidii MF-1]|nr:hypothetical protein [Austropuccinia psidii MF-1]